MPAGSTHSGAAGRMMGRLAVLLVLAAVHAVPGATQPARGSSATWAQERLLVDVPVPVIVFGLPQESLSAMRDLLQPRQVDHLVYDDDQLFPLQPEDPGAPLNGGDLSPNPVLPTARFDVVGAPTGLRDAFANALESWLVEPGVYNGNAAEDWLAETLPRHGFDIDPDAPSVVVFHLAEFGVGGHEWKLRGQTGYLKRARVFGERHPLLVLDPSANVDPRAGRGGYLSPVDPAQATLMADFVDDAVEFRVLQGPLFRVPTAPCNALTAILAVGSASLAEATDLMRAAEETFNPARIEASFEELSGTEVFVDHKILRLPTDDPVLDALARTGTHGRDTLPGYLTQNWDRYHVDRPGCEEYLSVVFVGDVASASGPRVVTAAGVSTYDDRHGKRIGLGWIPDLIRQNEDRSSPAWAALRDAGVCRLAFDFADNDDCSPDDSYVEYYQLWNTLLIHETGHLFGQRHPSDVDASVGLRLSDAFTTVWTTMSRTQANQVLGFGAVDRANWLRNRAGSALLEGARAGLEGSPAWNHAMEAAARLDWQQVWNALQD